MKSALDWKKASPKEIEALLMRAHAAGMAAGRGVRPPTMIVERHVNPLDDGSPVDERWGVPDGPCGFAWVTLKPANSRIAKAMKRLFTGEFGGRADRDSYSGGMMLWVWEFRQSMVRKSAYADAFVATLREAGVGRAYAGSRLD